MSQRGQADGSLPASRAPQVNIVLRPLGSALPLGFFAFGTGMALLASTDIPIVPRSELHPMAIMLLSFVAPLEILASVLAFLARDGMAGTGLGLFAASWATVGLQDLLAKPGSTLAVFGLYLICFAVVVALLGAVALRGQPLLGTLLVVSSLRTVLAGIYEITSRQAVFTTAGILALVITVIAYYGAVAFLLEDSERRTILPLGRRAAARRSLEGRVEDQLEGIELEAGVRRTL